MRILVSIIVLLAVVATVYPAVVHGRRSFRWGKDSAAAAIAERLAAFPEKIGDWQMIDESPLPDATVDMLRPLSVISRIYQNEVTLQKANIFILFGPSGPTAAHTPDICFDSRDFKSLGQRRKMNVGTGDSTCWAIKFQSKSVNKFYLQSWYAWTTDGTWANPANPRFHFAKSRTLVKIQVAIPYDDVDSMNQDKVTLRFLSELESILKRRVF